MSSDDLRTTLDRLGERLNLGEYGTDAYLAVLEHGELTASEISEQTDIPQPRVYDTVRSLSDRGLVELRETRPMKVVAIDPSTSFAEVESSLQSALDELEARYTAPARETEAVSLVRSRSTILRYLEEIVASAEYELSLSLTPSLLERYRAELAAAVERGVGVDLVITPGEEAPDPETFDYAAVCTNARTRRGLTTPIIAVADGTYSIYATQDALRDDRERYGVIFNRSALGFLLSGFHGTVLWTTGEPVPLDPAERSFPRAYATMRRCVRDIQHVEGELYAAIRGRDVTTGDQRVVRGKIAEYVWDPGEQLASLTIETGDGTVTVGGQVASIEDMETHELWVGREEPPQIEP